MFRISCAALTLVGALNLIPTTVHAAQDVKGARPAELSQSIADIQSHRAANAARRLVDWINANKEHPARPEAWYLLGQAQQALGDFDAARESHDEAQSTANDRTLKALATFALGEDKYQLKRYNGAASEWESVEHKYRDVAAIPMDELFFKLGMAYKKDGQVESADTWFSRVLDYYGSSKYASLARAEHSRLRDEDRVGYFRLEVAQFGKEREAQKDAVAWRKKGYFNVQVREQNPGDDATYSVEVGQYVNRTDAERAQEDLSIMGVDSKVLPHKFMYRPQE